MPKYKDKACEHCGKIMQHVYCSTRYCPECSKIVRSDYLKAARAGERSKRALATIASVERAAKAAGMSYGQYVARYDPPKPREKGKP